MNMLATIVPKSDQMNSDDLIGGPRTITVTRVSVNPRDEQPASLSYEGDEGKPYKPCKSMRRVLVECWGADASNYVGRSMTLYRDAKVSFGGMEVGGIRISHLSHIEKRRTLALTATRGKKAGFVVEPMQQAQPSKAEMAANALIDRIERAGSMADLEAITGDAKVIEQRAWLTDKRADLAGKVNLAVTEALDRLAPAADDAALSPAQGVE